MQFNLVPILFLIYFHEVLFSLSFADIVVYFPVVAVLQLPPMLSFKILRCLSGVLLAPPAKGLALDVFLFQLFFDLTVFLSPPL